MAKLLEPREAYKRAVLISAHVEPVTVKGRRTGKYRLVKYDRFGEVIESSVETTKDKAWKFRDREIMRTASELCGGPEALDVPDLYTMATRRELTALAGLVMEVRHKRMKERRDKARLEKSLRTKAEKHATQSERWNKTFRANLQKRIDYLKTCDDPDSRQMLAEAEAQLAKNKAKQKPNEDFRRLTDVGIRLRQARAAGDKAAEALLLVEREEVLFELRGPKPAPVPPATTPAPPQAPVVIPPAPDNPQALASARAAVLARHPGLPPHAVETLAVLVASVL